MYFFAQPSAFPASPTPGDGNRRNLFSLLMIRFALFNDRKSLEKLVPPEARQIISLPFRSLQAAALPAAGWLLPRSRCRIFEKGYAR